MRIRLPSLGRLLVAGFLLLLLAGQQVRAQDVLWTVVPGDGPTVEFPGGSVDAVNSDQCIQIDLNITVAPPNFRVFVEAKDNIRRYSREIIPLFQRPVVGTHSLCINLTDLGLENPDTGEVDLSNRFDPDSEGTISLVGVHIWDGAKQADLVITRFGIISSSSAPTTPPQQASEDSADPKLCIAQSVDVRTHNPYFEGNFEDVEAHVFTITGGKITPREDVLRLYSESDGLTGFGILYDSSDPGLQPTDSAWLLYTC